jgi:hypothetical protein
MRELVCCGADFCRDVVEHIWGNYTRPNSESRNENGEEASETDKTGAQS